MTFIQQSQDKCGYGVDMLGTCMSVHFMLSIILHNEVIYTVIAKTYQLAQDTWNWYVSTQTETDVCCLVVRGTHWHASSSRLNQMYNGYNKEHAWTCICCKVIKSHDFISTWTRACCLSAEQTLAHPHLLDSRRSAKCSYTRKAIKSLQRTHHLCGVILHF